MLKCFEFKSYDIYVYILKILYKNNIFFKKIHNWIATSTNETFNVKYELLDLFHKKCNMPFRGLVNNNVFKIGALIECNFMCY